MASEFNRLPNRRIIMLSNNGKRCPALLRGICGLWTSLALFIAASARPAEAAPFAYVTNKRDNTVSIIDTVTNTVAATVAMAIDPEGVAVSRDGKFVYVANVGSDNVSVISTASNTVAATVAVESLPFRVHLWEKQQRHQSPGRICEPGSRNLSPAIPPGFFTGSGFGPFFFFNQVNGVDLQIAIAPKGAKRYAIVAPDQDSKSGAGDSDD
jgi:YVTN family beta-propeller protein